MKKGKITMIITIGLACFVLAMVMSMQFKMVNVTDFESIENMREDELEEELAKWKSKNEEIEIELADTYAKIDEYNANIETDNESAELIEEELSQVNEILRYN